MVGLIYRAPEYSPGDNVAKDAAILEAIGHQLEQTGIPVSYLQEESLTDEWLQGLDVCVSMARRWKNLLLLQKMQLQGLRVLNRPNAVQVTVQSRSTTLELLQSAGLPVVPFWSYEPSEDEMFMVERELQNLLPGWVKAMHPRGVTQGDVAMVHTPLETDTRILQLVAEGYTDIIVTRHLEGSLLKTYVVGQQCWPQTEHAALALKVASVMGLDIMGVDMIVTDQGPYIIDVNDFPSFSACRTDAAEAVTELISSYSKLVYIIK